MPERKCISIITPCYNEMDNIIPCYDAVRTIFEQALPHYDYEHLFCDNSSSDKTPDILRALAAADHRVKVILNARNFGPSRSAFNGMMAATGQAVLLFLPVDLQDPPELLPDFVEKWEQGFEVVYGIRTSREEGWLLRKTRTIYYHAVATLADITIPRDVGDFQFIDRIVVEALRKFDDYHPYLRGMVASCGFRAFGVEYAWKARQRGVSKNRLYHLVDQGLNGLVSFTNLPMRLCMFSGLILSAVSILYALVTFCATLLYRIIRGEPIAPAGVPTLIVAIFFFSGVQLFFLGLLGEYVSAIHSQVRKRPLVVERERINIKERGRDYAL